MNITFLKEMQRIMETNEPAWLLTVTASEGSTPGKPGIKMILHEDGTFIGTIGGGNVEKRVMVRVLEERPDKPQKWQYDLSGEQLLNPTDMICGGMQEIFVEPLYNVQSLYILGGGHCGIALSELATKCGFHVTVIDDREEWASRAKHPFAADVVCTDYEKASEIVKDHSYVVIMTHGHKHDGMVLRQFLKRDMKYVGMIGSKNKVKTTFDRFLAEGFSQADLDAVHAPIGFPIGSQTPEEIAVSVMAQLIAVKYGKLTTNN
ncbi:MAG TPA: XdhC/CoxI family protein [Candidatus Cloacimonadota bacterium]|nr:XdhC/CoxI family protein [Candidatus Cloacimonadota bacterium]